MSTIGIVTLALLGGIFIAILIGALVGLIYFCLRLHKATQTHQAELRQMTEDQRLSIQKFQSDNHKMIETYSREMALAVSHINGEGLEVASKQILNAATRIEKAAMAFGELAKWMLADRDNISSNGNGAGLKPDEYAASEPGEHFTGVSPTTEDDIASQIDEG